MELHNYRLGFQCMYVRYGQRESLKYIQQAYLKSMVLGVF